MPQHHDRTRLTRDRAVALTVRRAPGDCAFLFDFDGTLSPITANAAQARPVAGAVTALAELVRLGASVTIVSARPVKFLRQHLDVPGLVLSGVYGLEVRTADGETRVDPEAAGWVPEVARVVAAARAELGALGAFVEDKHLSVGLHFRTAPELEDRVAAWAVTAAASTGLAVQHGRMVVELRPPIDRDKGSVIAERLHGFGCAWYFGDDKADIAAFEALHRHGTGATPGGAPGPAGGFLPVAVAVHNPEGGAALAAVADFTVDSPQSVVGLVGELATAWQGDN